MKYNELNLTANKKPNRVGRGISAGRGKTAGRGTKGQKARKSGGVRNGFEGGQTPLAMRLPKLRGFTSKRPLTQEVYTLDLNTIKAKVVDNVALVEAGLIADAYLPAKLLYNGEVTNPVEVSLQNASAKAIKSVQAAGGKFTKIARLKRVSLKN